MSAAQLAEIMLLRPETMKPKKKSKIDKEICVRYASSLYRVKPKADARHTARKEIGERLL